MNCSFIAYNCAPHLSSNPWFSFLCSTLATPWLHTHILVCVCVFVCVYNRIFIVYNCVPHLSSNPWLSSLCGTLAAAYESPSIHTPRNPPRGVHRKTPARNLLHPRTNRVFCQGRMRWTNSRNLFFWLHRKILCWKTFTGASHVLCCSLIQFGE